VTTAAVVVEERATKALAQFRKKGVIAKNAATSLDLVVVPDGTRIDEAGSCIVTLRLTLSGELTRQIEQEVLFVTGATLKDPKTNRLFAYIDGWAQAIGAIFKRHKTPETITPADLVFPEALDTKAKDALGFAEKILIAVDERADAVQDELEEPEKPLSPKNLATTKPIAQNDELEASIRQAPDDRERYLVYADWLSERNDPRGELSICQANADQDAAARGRADEILRVHRRYFLGAFAAEDYLIGTVLFTWHLGWVDSINFTTIAEPGMTTGGDTFLGAMKLPSTKFLRSLRIGRLSYDEEPDMVVMWSALTEAGPRPTLKALDLGDEDEQISWMCAGSIPVVLPQLYPNLEVLKIRAGRMKLDAKALALPKLKTLIIESGGLARENAQAIVKACVDGLLPALTKLEIWFGSASYGGTTTIDDLLPLLATSELQNLTDLGLKNAELTDDIARALKDASILRTVKNLDLSMGVMTNPGAAALVTAKASMPLLETLDVSKNYLLDGDIELLEGLCPHVSANEQKDWDPEVDDPEDRYVSLSE
jgi:uncharacterized protein (TIGR02996 family)